MNNSDESEASPKGDNRRLMDEENESDTLAEIAVTLDLPIEYDNMFKPDYCDICGRLMSTHIICDGPDAS